MSCQKRRDRRGSIHPSILILSQQKLMVERMSSDAQALPVMLTGDQIAAARRLAGIRTQADLATAAGVSRPTVERAEAVRGAIPAMGTTAMGKIVRALESSGVQFVMSDGGLTMRARA